MPSVDLLSPGRIDGFDIRNRMFMAPMTRGAAPSRRSAFGSGDRVLRPTRLGRSHHHRGHRASRDWNRLCADAVDRHA